MHRRRFLAAALGVSTAGCVRSPLRGDMAAELPTASLSMEAVSDEGITRKLTRNELPDERRAMVATLVENGTATFDWHQEPPLYEGRPVLHDGVVYDLTSTVVDRRPVTNFAVKVDIPQSTPAAAETVQFADLPAADRAVFEREGFADGGPVGVGTTFTYTPEEVSSSVLVPDPEYEYVAWEGGETAEWVVGDSWDAEQKRYRYEAEAVAPAAAYGADVRERYGFELSGLTDAERDVVEQAVADDHGYTVPPDETPSPGMERLADRFRDHEEVAVHHEPSPGASGRYLPEYDGTVYWTSLRWRADWVDGTDDEDGATGTATGTGD